MRLMTQTIRNRALRRALIAGGSLALGAMSVPALADTLGYYYDGPPVVTQGPTTTTTTYTYTYTEPTPTYVEPAPPVVVYEHRERGPGVYLDTPVLNFGIGFH